MKKLEKILGFIDAANEYEIRQMLFSIVGWKVFVSRSETILRRDTALALYSRMQSNEAGALEHSREFLHQVAQDQQTELGELIDRIVRK
jgi:hypothetical protein